MCIATALDWLKRSHFKRILLLVDQGIHYVSGGRFRHQQSPVPCPLLKKPTALDSEYCGLTATHCFEKQKLKMHVNASHKTAIFVKSGHILLIICPLVFPLMFDDCSVCLQPFILAELSPATTRCCSCSFGLQAAYMFLFRNLCELRQSSRRTSSLQNMTQFYSNCCFMRHMSMHC